jgi:formylglycine-generating enzyme required for sulfatase activity
MTEPTKISSTERGASAQNIQEIEAYLDKLVSALRQGEFPVNLEKVTNVFDRVLIEESPLLDIPSNKLLTLYNDTPRVLVAYSIEANITNESSSKNDPKMVFFGRENQGNYWLIRVDATHAWLIPNPTKKIQIERSSSLSLAFDFDRSNSEMYISDLGLTKLTLTQIMPTEPPTWKVIERGMLGKMRESHADEDSIQMTVRSQVRKLSHDLEDLRKELRTSNRSGDSRLIKLKKKIQELEIEEDKEIKNLRYLLGERLDNHDSKISEQSRIINGVMEKLSENNTLIDFSLDEINRKMHILEPNENKILTFCSENIEKQSGYYNTKLSEYSASLMAKIDTVEKSLDLLNNKLSSKPSTFNENTTNTSKDESIDSLSNKMVIHDTKFTDQDTLIADLKIELVEMKTLITHNLLAITKVEDQLKSLVSEQINSSPQNPALITTQPQQASTKPVQSPHQKSYNCNLGNGVELSMICVPAGEFMMGLPVNESGGLNNERPQHLVKIPTFYMSKYAVTQEQYFAIMGKNPSNFQGKNLPVEKVSWHEAKKFCEKLGMKTGKDFRLPSESEWEYACRANTITPFYFGETIDAELANYRAQHGEAFGHIQSGTYGQGKLGVFRAKTTSVDSFPANDFGLHDMHGNVWEWCEDIWQDSYKRAPIDGSASFSGLNDQRVRRGGSWFMSPNTCRSAARGNLSPDSRNNDVGFRVVCN